MHPKQPRAVVQQGLTLVVAAATSAAADTILVPLQLPTVAAAIEQAQSGDTVLVVLDAPGGGWARAPDGLRIVGRAGAVVRGDLQIVGRGVRLERVRFRDGVVRIVGDDNVIEDLSGTTEYSPLLELTGSRNAVSDISAPASSGDGSIGRRCQAQFVGLNATLPTRLPRPALVQEPIEADPSPAEPPSYPTIAAESGRAISLIRLRNEPLLCTSIWRPRGYRIVIRTSIRPMPASSRPRAFARSGPGTGFADAFIA